MSNDNDENLRRFRALIQGNQDIQPEISSSVSVLTPREQQQQQQRLQQPQSVQRQHQSQPIQRQQPQVQSGLRQHQSQLMQRQQPTHSQPEQRQQEQQQQQQKEKQKKKKKKKCRGNRKCQRFRAKLRKRGLNNEEITTLMNDYNNVNQDQNDEQSTVSDMNVELLVPIHNQQETLENNNVNQTKPLSKRKRDSRPTGVTTSMSQMSISNLLPKKRQRSTTVDNIIEQNSSDKSTSNNKPKYLKVPDQVFKEMLSKSLVGTESIVQLLDTPEKLQFVRTYAHLLNNVFYLKLEQDFWQHYNTVCMSEDIWSVPIVKDMAKENNLCRFKFKTKAQLERHHKLILNRFQVAENKLNQHKQQTINRSIDMNKLSMVVTAFVRQQQNKLSVEFERKKLILQLDANDHRLVKAFYNLKPTENQIRSTKIIWQAAKDKLQAEEEIAILKQRIYTKRLPSSFAMLDHSIDNIENMLKQPALNQDKRATLSFRRLKTIAQFKYDMMILTITTAEETLRTHDKIIANEKKKLIDTIAGGQVPMPKSLVQLMNAIAARQSNMVQRSQLILKQKLSVFDDAPMAINMAAGVAIGAM